MTSVVIMTHKIANVRINIIYTEISCAKDRLMSLKNNVITFQRFKLKHMVIIRRKTCNPSIKVTLNMMSM